MFKIRRVLAPLIWPDVEAGLYESESHLERGYSNLFKKRIGNPYYGTDPDKEEIEVLKAPILFPNAKMRPEDMFKTRELGLVSNAFC